MRLTDVVATLWHIPGDADDPLPDTPMPPTITPLPLHLSAPFTIAHGTSTRRTNALVQIGGGWGEGALPPYYPHRLDDIAGYVRALPDDLLTGDAALHLEHALDRLPDGPEPARAAVDMALHDRWARQLGHPLYRLWGLDPADSPLSSYTLAIPASEDALREQLAALRGFPILKLKLGTGSLETDEAIVRIARDTTSARLCVDANGAWSVDHAARIIPRLAACEVLFVEQPIPDEATADWKHLRQQLPADAPPLIADESVQTSTDVLRLHDAVDGVNVKLAKAGGLREARRMIGLARTLELRVMIGCMIESSLALTAAAHLAPLADYADLDAFLLIDDDPFVGATMQQGRLTLPERPGLGVQKKPSE
ncbi:MAG: dipeptide epimerase [Bacteroidetes bacterium]|nr:dipeptide epimerase [Bacteroidota bacterium]